MGRLPASSLTYVVKSTYVEVGGRQEDASADGLLAWGDADYLQERDCISPTQKLEVPNTPSPFMRPACAEPPSMLTMGLDCEFGLPPAYMGADFGTMEGCLDGQDMNGVYMHTMMFDPSTGNYVPYWGMPMDPSCGGQAFDGQCNDTPNTQSLDEARDVGPTGASTAGLMTGPSGGFSDNINPMSEDQHQQAFLEGHCNDGGCQPVGHCDEWMPECVGGCMGGGGLVGTGEDSQSTWCHPEGNCMVDGQATWSGDGGGDWMADGWTDGEDWDRREGDTWDRHGAHSGDFPWKGDEAGGDSGDANTADAPEASTGADSSDDHSPESACAEEPPQSLRGHGRGGRKGGEEAKAAAKDAEDAGLDSTAASDGVPGAVANGPVNYTTVMLRNIPNKYSREMLVKQLSRPFRGTFDFLYLPIDFKNRCNVGYGFINFRSVEFCDDFVTKFNGVEVRKCLPGLNSRKVAEVTPARVQGLEENVRRLRNSPVMNELILRPEWMPLLLDEDGHELPFPLPDQPAPPTKSRRRGHERAGRWEAK